MKLIFNPSLFIKWLSHIALKCHLLYLLNLPLDLGLFGASLFFCIFLKVHSHTRTKLFCNRFQYLIVLLILISEEKVYYQACTTDIKFAMGLLKSTVQKQKGNLFTTWYFLSPWLTFLLFSLLDKRSYRSTKPLTQEG